MTKEEFKALFRLDIGRFTFIEKSDLLMLVKMALDHEEISLSKASELLGLPLEDVRILASDWFKGR